MKQYYYRDYRCRAQHPELPECCCWHDVGTDPFPDLLESDIYFPDSRIEITWRERP